MVVANSNNCSNCSMHECVNRQWMFLHAGHIYAQVSLPTPVFILVTMDNNYLLLNTINSEEYFHLEL